VSQPIEIRREDIRREDIRREDIRAAIENLELLEGIEQALEDMQNCDLTTADRVRVRIEGDKGESITYVMHAHPFMALAALQSMKQSLQAQLRAKQIEVA